jgi:hypothetical protein
MPVPEMKMERLAALPDWPARMTADVACLFMCISENTFLSRYGTQGVIREGHNVFWSREWLEREVARQAGLEAPSDGWAV